MMCISAAGKVMPTFVIYEKNLPLLAVNDDLPQGWLHGVSPNGGWSVYSFKAIILLNVQTLKYI